MGDPENIRRKRKKEKKSKKTPSLVEQYQRRVYWGDEMRYGTRTELKRRWTPKGHRPRCPMKIGYQFGYLYCLLCPFTGDLFCLLLPSMQKACFGRILEEFAKDLGKKTA